jgi:hypothetical protein
MGSLGELLDSMPNEQRQADWERRDRIVKDFLASDDQRTARAGWPFSFFVAAFRGLALGEQPSGRSGAQRALRTEDVYQDLSKGKAVGR